MELLQINHDEQELHIVSIPSRQELIHRLKQLEYRQGELKLLRNIEFNKVITRLKIEAQQTRKGNK